MKQSLLSMTRRCLARPIKINVPTQSHFRSAHAARMPDPDPEPGPSDPGPSHTSKFRSSGRVHDEYCFPKMGRMGGSPDPYEVLGLERSAGEAEIKKKYYRLAMILHPDSSHPASSHADFATLHRAYTLLSSSQSRQQYLASGYGWSARGDVSEMRGSSFDDAMRAEVLRRRRGGAASYGHGYGNTYTHHRRSDAGSGAWGGYAYGDGMGWHPNEDATGFTPPPKGKGEALYMSNERFMSVFIGICVVAAWINYHRVGMSTESSREVLRQQHVDASTALAEARQGAARFGKMRREAIKRRARELETIRETDQLEAGGHGASSSVMAIGPPEHHHASTSLGSDASPPSNS